MKRTRASNPTDFKTRKILLSLSAADMARVDRVRERCLPPPGGKTPPRTAVVAQALREFLDRWEASTK